MKAQRVFVLALAILVVPQIVSGAETEHSIEFIVCEPHRNHKQRDVVGDYVDKRPNYRIGEMGGLYVAKEKTEREPAKQRGKHAVEVAKSPAVSLRFEEQDDHIVLVLRNKLANRCSIKNRIIPFKISASMSKQTGDLHKTIFFEQDVGVTLGASLLDPGEAERVDVTAMLSRFSARYGRFSFKIDTIVLVDGIQYSHLESEPMHFGKSKSDMPPKAPSGAEK